MNRDIQSPGLTSLVIFLLCVVLGPLLVFAPQLAQAKRTGLREYGTLAERYVREFDAKWLRGGAPADEPLVGSGDIQSLADLAMASRWCGRCKSRRLCRWRSP